MPGIIEPILDHVLVSHMHFGEDTTKGGIILKSDDGKVHGIKPRWGKVWAIGPKQTDVKIGEWILVEHGRWSRVFEHTEEDGSKINLQLIDTKAILLVADEKPADLIIN